jgi:hypothetical protein
MVVYPVGASEKLCLKTGVESIGRTFDGGLKGQWANRGHGLASCANGRIPVAKVCKRQKPTFNPIARSWSKP